MIVGRGKKSPRNERDFQRWEISRTRSDDVALIFLSNGDRPAFLDEANRAAAPAYRYGRGHGHAFHARQVSQPFAELMLELNRGGTVKRIFLAAGVRRVRQVHGESQQMSGIESGVLMQQRVQAL